MPIPFLAHFTTVRSEPETAKTPLHLKGASQHPTLPPPSTTFARIKNETTDDD